MPMIVIKYAVTALIIVLVSEVAKRSDKLGALISSLPFVTLMVMIWLQVERQGYIAPDGPEAVLAVGQTDVLGVVDAQRDDLAAEQADELVEGRV